MGLYEMLEDGLPYGVRVTHCIFGENALTLGRWSWAKFKEHNGLSENSYLELLRNRAQKLIKEHGQTGSISANQREVDPRTVPYVNIVDTYAKSGEHLKSVCTCPNGDIIWDGMVETGPGCMERIQARIDALPDGHQSKVQLIPKEFK